MTANSVDPYQIIRIDFKVIGYILVFSLVCQRETTVVTS